MHFPRSPSRDPLASPSWSRAETRLAEPPHLGDLGYRAADILQSNCVIWVERPSDRLYIRRWIELIDESLVENLHYSIMFYGGKLLNHLAISDDAVSEFIKLRLLNRHSGIVMDSDRTSPDASITKRSSESKASSRTTRKRRAMYGSRQDAPLRILSNATVCEGCRRGKLKAERSVWHRSTLG
jgi:hypothetical protein